MTSIRVWSSSSANHTHADQLARVPTRWNHLVQKKSRKINFLSMITAPERGRGRFYLMNRGALSGTSMA